MLIFRKINISPWIFWIVDIVRWKLCYVCAGWKPFSFPRWSCNQCFNAWQSIFKLNSILGIRLSSLLSRLTWWSCILVRKFPFNLIINIQSRNISGKLSKVVNWYDGNSTKTDNECARNEQHNWCDPEKRKKRRNKKYWKHDEN